MIKLAIKIGFVWVLLTISGCTDFDNTNNDLPQKLGDLTLSKVHQGSQAAAVIHKMHGKKLGARRNFIGYYGKAESTFNALLSYDFTSLADSRKKSHFRMETN